jgi:hypothetical protein
MVRRRPWHSSRFEGDHGRVKRFLVSTLLLVSCTSGHRERVSSSIAPLVRTAHPMIEKRGRFACVELLGGSVLAIASDIPGGIYSSTAERFDPASATWKATGNLANGRWEHGAARMNDGKVLVAGGYEDDKTPAVISSAEIYDPVAGTFTAAASMLGGRKFPALVTLPDNSVLALGGEDDITGSLSTAERYNPATNTWTALPPTNDVHTPGRAVRLATGKVLLTGGVATPEIFDPLASTFTSTPPMKTPRDLETLTLLADGRVLVAGGRDSSSMPLSSAEIYDPAANTWTVTGSMAHARMEHAAVRVASGLVLIGGGESTGDLEAYDPGSGRFVDVGYLAMPREALCATTQGTGAMFLGGSSVGDFNAYVPIADHWVPSPGGEKCAVDGECESGKCASGVCTGGASPTDGGTESGLPTSDAGFDSVPSGSSPIAPSSFQRCAKNSECSTGHCVDGVCCDTACTETCHSCALPSSPGKCTTEPVGVDLKGECGAALSCTGTCGPSGACIGSGPGAPCSKSRCTSASAGVGPATCVASGAACPTDQAVPFDCGAYACEPAFGACLASCSSSADCAGGYLCDTASKTCSAPAPSGDSGGCTYGNGSTSGLSLAALLALLALARRKNN